MIKTKKPEGPKAAINPTKHQLVVDLLKRDGGANLDEMVAATGWLPHTARAALTGLRKSGEIIENDKVDGVRRFLIVVSVQ